MSLLKKTIKYERPNLVHAHYGLSGLLAILQKDVPVVITFHGSDINNWFIGILSAMASFAANYRIFVSNNLYEKLLIKPKACFSIIPCGVNLEVFYPIDKSIAIPSFNAIGRGIRKALPEMMASAKYCLPAAGFITN